MSAFPALQLGQSTASALPHCVQNFLPTGFSDLHFAQRIAVAPRECDNIATKGSIAQESEDQESGGNVCG